MKKKITALLASLLTVCLIVCAAYVPVFADGGTVNGKITVDGDLDDWTDIPEQKSGDGEISWWKAAKDADGNLYVCFTGPASTQWYGNYNWKHLTLSQGASDWTKNGFQITNTQNFSGGTLATVNTANGNTAGSYYVELMVPASYFTNTGALQISLGGGTTLSWNDVPQLSGTDVKKEDDDTYKGIKIDGKFRDWNAVTKYDASCPNPSHPDCISQAAMVFDGDYVYIYVKDGKGSTAAGAGSHSNGNFAITTDLGRQVILHFRSDGTVTSSQISGIQSRHVGSEWEVSVPANQLPKYKETISFGLYSADSSDGDGMFVKDVANMNGSRGNADDFSGIVYDGDYSDWDSYPHSLIQYATSGTQAELVDGEAALYSNDGKIYGHVYTEMAQHLSEHGREFAQAVSIRLNREDGKAFYPRFVEVDENGNINWNPSFADGQTKEYYIVDSQGWSSARTLDELNDGKHGNSVYGKITITTNSAKRDECEYYLDTKTLARKFNLDENDIQYVEAKYGRIGPQWTGTAGASTNPALGVGICIAAVAAVLLWQRRKRKAADERGNGAETK